MPSISHALTSRMSYLTARQGVIAGNIANADTPGYLARDLMASKSGAASGTFGMVLTQAGHLGGQMSPSLAGTLVEDTRFLQQNGNSVRLDQELLKQQQNSLDYRLMTQLYSKNMQLQQTALGRGR
jgi:flagellar basal-body rod protein FlgB